MLSILLLITIVIATLQATTNANASVNYIFKNKTEAGDFLNQRIREKQKYIEFNICVPQNELESNIGTDIIYDYALNPLYDKNNRDFYYYNVYYKAKYRKYKEYNIGLRQNTLKLIYNMDYTYTDKKERITYKRVKQITKKLKLKKEKSTCDKIKKIYKYVIRKIKRYSSKHATAYDAITKRKGSCVAYSTLFYLICKQAHIPCRIIDNVKHAWNIVKIGNKWYNCDTTWGDKCPTRRYFLRGRTDTPGHKGINAEYASSEYKRLHPISKKDFKIDPNYLKK